MTQGMPRRRHLFDKGYPVTKATLLAGSHVLIALSHQAVRTSLERRAASFFRLADSAGRMMSAAERCENYTQILSHGKATRGTDRAIAAGVGIEPGARPAGEEPHQE